ncbi:MAG: putative ABC transporter permease [Deltaproteobacteria bacterium]|nr:putative ABC transporter permease [Deltaproteobacteria bacterium]
MKLSLLNILFSFSFFSSVGWVLEVLYRSLANRRFINPGLLKGPYLILYGTGALALIGVISCIQEYSFLVKVLVYFVATTGLELVAALMAEKFFQARLWDYSKERFQFRGHICLKFSFYWVLLAFGFEYLLFPLFQTMNNYMGSGIKFIFMIIVTSLILTDFLFVVWNSLLLGSKKN